MSTASKSSPRRLHGLAGGLLLWSAAVSASQALAADEVLLRDLAVEASPVVGWDVDGVTVQTVDAGRRTIGWERVESATLDGAGRQASFDAMLKSVGDHVFRIHSRLKVRDYEDLLPHAEALLETYRGRTSPTAAMVFQSLMWAQLARGRREEAVEPYLLTLGCMGESLKALAVPGPRRPAIDADTGLATDLPPLWTDAAAAAAALPRVERVIADSPKPLPPAAYVYAATLAFAAGKPDDGRAQLARIQRPAGPVKALLEIVEAQREVESGKFGPALTRLSGQITRLPQPLCPLAHYWLGRGLLTRSDEGSQLDGLIQLMHVPALYGAQHPEISAAALDVAARVYAQRQRPVQAQTLRQEILTWYPQTSVAQLLSQNAREKTR